MEPVHRDIKKLISQENLEGMVKDSLNACEVYYQTMMKNTPEIFTEEQVVVLTDALCYSFIMKEGFYEFIMKKQNQL